MKRLFGFGTLTILSVLIVALSCVKQQESLTVTAAGTIYPSETQGMAYDDIVNAPGGAYYRASIHGVDSPVWPGVVETEIVLNALGGTIRFRYRAFIETEAGETRNNIIHLFGYSAPDLVDPMDVQYYVVNLPEGFSIQMASKHHSGLLQNKYSKMVLEIIIGSQVEVGEYSFILRFEYKGEELANLPCTISVIE